MRRRTRQALLTLSRFPVLRTNDPHKAQLNIATRHPGFHELMPQSDARAWKISANSHLTGQIRISSVVASACSFAMAADGLARIVLPSGAPLECEHRGETRIFATGSARWLPLDNYRIRLGDGARNLVVTIRETELANAIRAADADIDVREALNRLTTSENSGLDLFETQLFAAVSALNYYPLDIIDQERFKRGQEELLTIYAAHSIARLRPRAQGEAVSSRVLRKALEFIASSLSEEIRLPAIAAHAGCSLRHLQVLFRRELDITVTGFVRQRRLRHARARLLAPEPEDTVTSVALACGFTHLSEFARHYYNTYGEKPFQSLAAARNGRVSA